MAPGPGRSTAVRMGLTGFLVVLAAGVFLLIFLLPKSIQAVGGQVLLSPEPSIEIGKDQPRVITIAAAGDLMMHQRQLKVARQKDGSYDFSGYFTQIAPYLNSADLSFANLETTLLGKNYSGYPQFCAPDSYLDAVKAAGFDVLTTANNHCLDTGLPGLIRTIDTVRARGFYQTGTYKSPEDFQKPLIIEANGIKVGVIAYTHGVGRENTVSPAVYSYSVRVWRKADYQKDVQACRDAGAQIVIACVHWGKEFSKAPVEEVRTAAKKMLEAGVDVILGSHPHVVQPIEIMEADRADGTKARCAVAYSLGNFISNQRSEYTCCGIVFRLTLQEDEQGRFQIKQMGYVPTYVNRDKNYKGYRVLPIAEYILDPSKQKTLDRENRAGLLRAWRDLSKLLGSGPATPVTAP